MDAYALRAVTIEVLWIYDQLRYMGGKTCCDNMILVSLLEIDRGWSYIKGDLVVH